MRLHLNEKRKKRCVYLNWIRLYLQTKTMFDRARSLLGNVQAVCLCAWNCMECAVRTLSYDEYASSIVY